MLDEIGPTLLEEIAAEKAIREESPKEDLSKQVSRYYEDPLGFVLQEWPWGVEGGPLEHSQGPDDYQTQFLVDLGKHIKDRKFDGHTPVAPIRMCISSCHGAGKAQPVDLLIETPDGERRFGDLKPGDRVFGADGRPTKVLAVHKRGILPIFRVSFDDASSTLACGDHLWTVRRKRRIADREWQTMSTQEILDRGVTHSNGGGLKARQWEIPQQGPVEYPYRWTPISPYALGAWLGDGSRQSSMITGEDPEIREKIVSDGHRCSETYYSVQGKKAGRFGLSQTIQYLRDLKLYDCYSYEKFIPDLYKRNIPEVRAELLRGLMDTDGYVTTWGAVSYTSTSRKLIEDIMWLARSLGGKTRMNKPKNPSYRDANGEKVACRVCYTALIRMPDGFEPFHLSRKKERLQKTSQGRYSARWMDSIEPAGEAECQCITVENPDGLYLTNDFIVTHNSTLGAWLAWFILRTRPGSIGTVTAGTYQQLDERTWAEIMYWGQIAKGGHLFDIQKSGVFHKDKKLGQKWKITPKTAKAENAQSFAGQHARTSTSFFIFDEACHDDRTEVLAKRGWTLFKDLLPEDELLSMNPETHIAEYVKPKAVHSTFRSGEMCVYKRRGCSFSVTPNHRMYVQRKDHRNRRFRPWGMVEAERIVGQHAYVYMSRSVKWNAAERQKITIPGFKSRNKDYPEVEVNFDAFMRFLGWYYSEGHLGGRKNSKGKKEHNTVGITNRDLSIPVSIAVELPWKATVYGCTTTPQMHIYDRALAEHLATFGVGCLNKRIPEYVMNASARQINLFLDEYVRGDGYRKTKGNDIIYTSSKILADQLQELCIKGGYTSTVTKRSIEGLTANFGTHNGTSTCDGYVVSRSSSDMNIQVKQRHVSLKPYSGMVYCATLEKYGLLYTRRDGVCMWSGNSEIPDANWGPSYAGMTDGHPMFFAWGQMIQNTGEFHKICFGSSSDKWDHRIWDGRKSAFTSKELIEEWREEYGEDSDFFRVRVLGLPPRASSLQFINQQTVDAARARNHKVLEDEPLVVGYDAANGGMAKHFIFFRRGLDAKSIPPISLPGDTPRDVIVAKLADILSDRTPERRVAALFGDQAFGAVILERLRNSGFTNVFEVNFGDPSPDRKYMNMRSYMWFQMREWLLLGAIPDDEKLAQQFMGPGFHHTNGRLVLESKESMAKRKIKSPDGPDALAATFFRKVAAPPRKPATAPKLARVGEHDWMAS